MKSRFSLALAAVVLSALCGFRAQAQSYGYTWKACERSDMGNATWPIDTNNNPIPTCMPDTLYTWTNDGQMTSFIWHAQNDTPGQLDLKHQMFFTRTPAMTFGYGQRQLRIKLRPDAKIVVQDRYARNCPVGDTSNTIYISYLAALNGWVEYILCSGAPVESWSTATSEGLTEINAEASWIASHQLGEWDTMNHTDMSIYGAASANPVKMYVADNHNDWTQTAWDANLVRIQQSLQQNPDGYVFYTPGVNQNRKEHFETILPGYFNQVASPYATVH